MIRAMHRVAVGSASAVLLIVSPLVAQSTQAAPPADSVASGPLRRPAIGDSVPTRHVNPWAATRRTAFRSLAITWGATVVGAALMGDQFIGLTAIPVVGPFVSRSLIEEYGSFRPGGQALLQTSGVLQAVSLGVGIGAWLLEASWTPPVAVVPTRDGAALVVHLRR